MDHFRMSRRRSSGLFDAKIPLWKTRTMGFRSVVQGKVRRTESSLYKRNSISILMA